jgi:hypothetical protein
MNHLREAAQQALEALEKTHTQPGCEQWQAERKASVALRAALAQEESGPEPNVAQLSAILDGLGIMYDARQSAREFLRVWIRDWTMHKIALAQQEPDLRNANPIGLTPLQKALQQAQFRADSLAQQEPTVRIKCTVVDNQHPSGIPFEQWVNAPRREWRSLSEDELTALGVIHSRYQEESLETGGWFDFARAIEAKLKEKNHG